MRRLWQCGFVREEVAFFPLDVIKETACKWFVRGENGGRDYWMSKGDYYATKQKALEAARIKATERVKHEKRKLEYAERMLKLLTDYKGRA